MKSFINVVSKLFSAVGGDTSGSFNSVRFFNIALPLYLSSPHQSFCFESLHRILWSDHSNEASSVSTFVVLYITFESVHEIPSVTTKMTIQYFYIVLCTCLFNILENKNAYPKEDIIRVQVS